MTAGSAVGAGLVSVSTTHTGYSEPSFYPVGPLGRLPILVEKELARFSRLQKNVGMAAKLHMLDVLPGSRQNVVMVTTTYRDGGDWRPVHQTAFITQVRNWYKRLTGDKLRYVWVAETQERGAIHYHCIFWLRKGVTMPKADKKGWWPHGMTNTIKSTAPVAYLMSYAKKIKSKKDLPHGARIYGVGGLPPACRRVRRWVNWPSFVQARAAVTDNFSRQVGGGWVNRASGEWFPSEYAIAYNTKRTTCLVRIHDHGRPIQDVRGPYSWIPGRELDSVDCEIAA